MFKLRSESLVFLYFRYFPTFRYFPNFRSPLAEHLTAAYPSMADPSFAEREAELERLMFKSEFRHRIIDSTSLPSDSGPRTLDLSRIDRTFDLLRNFVDCGHGLETRWIEHHAASLGVLLSYASALNESIRLTGLSGRHSATSRRTARPERVPDSVSTLAEVDHYESELERLRSFSPPDAEPETPDHRDERRGRVFDTYENWSAIREELTSHFYTASHGSHWADRLPEVSRLTEKFVDGASPLGISYTDP